MPVVGSGAYAISHSGEIADAKAYDPKFGTTHVPIVDTAVQYDCPYTGQSSVLVIRNALHVPSMHNHLILTFMMREAGGVVNDTPKIQVVDPDVTDHSIFFGDDKMRIPLFLNGIFSYFPSTKPTAQMIQECEDIYLLTPSRWDPHNTAYAHNEEQMSD